MGKLEANVKIIAQEINAIVSAPYAVLFKTLLCLLADIDDGELHVWTIAKSCQISVLVSRILNSLDVDGSAWPVLLKLIRIRIVRDEVIRQNPWIVKRLLSRTDDQNVFDACLAICAEPFPQGFAPPIECFSFISSLLENNHEAHENIWVTQVCVLLSAMPESILWGLEDQTLLKCQTRCNNAAKTADNATFVRFMLIAALVYKRFGRDTPTPDEHVAKRTALHDWAARCSSLFNHPRSVKIIKSLLLRALFFLSDKSEVPLGEVLQCLDQIRQVLAVMNKDACRAATEEQEVNLIVVKLAQKSTQVTLPITARICTLGILQVVDYEGKLLRTEEFQSTFEEFFLHQLQMTQCQKALTKPWTSEVLMFQLDHHDLIQSIEKFYLRHVCDMGPLLQSITNLCKPSKVSSTEMMCSLTLAVTFMQSIFATIVNEVDGDLRKSIAAVQLPDWWDWDLNAFEGDSSCARSSMCQYTMCNLQTQLRTSISKVVIASACASETVLSNSNFRLLEGSMGSSFVRTISHQHPLTHQPEVIEDRAHTLFDSFLTPSPSTCNTPTIPFADSLSEINEWTQRAIQSYINRVCRDLQERCQNIELPLQAERARYEELQAHFLEIQGSLEVALADHRARRLSWQHEMELVEQASDNLREQLVKLQQELDTAVQKAEDNAAKAERGGEHVINLTAQCEGLQEELKCERSKVGSSEEECKRLAHNNQSLQKQLKDAQEKEQRLMCVLRGGGVDISND